MRRSVYFLLFDAEIFFGNHLNKKKIESLIQIYMLHNISILNVSLSDSVLSCWLLWENPCHQIPVLTERHSSCFCGELKQATSHLQRHVHAPDTLFTFWCWAHCYFLSNQKFILCQCFFFLPYIHYITYMLLSSFYSSLADRRLWFCKFCLCEQFMVCLF